MNDLNTQQIVLLCLLVSFVTAVATGITTVSLMDQSPQPVAQTINRIVERTVETIIETPEDISEPIIERVVETVVVNQEDLTVEAVAKSSQSFVRIYGLNRAGDRFFAGVGVIVDAKGKVITASSVGQMANSFEIDYKEATFSANVTEESSGRISVLIPSETGDTVFTNAPFGDSQSLKLAQSVIVLSGAESNVVATGIITGLVTASGEVSEEDITAGTVPVEVLNKIDTSVNSAGISPGSILMNLKGEVVGISAGPQTTTNSFVPSNSIKLLIAS